MVGKRKRKTKEKDESDSEVISSSSVSLFSDSDTDGTSSSENYLPPSLNPHYKLYADRLSVFEDRGLVGDSEYYDDQRVIQCKSKQLAQLIQQHLHDKKRIIILSGAGISTSCGIPDFRGTNGVWTLEERKHRHLSKQQKQLTTHGTHHEIHQPDGKHNGVKKFKGAGTHSTSPLSVKNENDMNTTHASSSSSSSSSLSGKHTSASSASTSTSINTPSLSHQAISTLVSHGMIHHVVSQNIDNLHLRSGIPRSQLVEIHGNLYAEQCHSYDMCGVEYIREYDMNGIGCRQTGRSCDVSTCRSPLYDKTYDWTSPLDDYEMARANYAFHDADLCIVVGTSLRVDPIGKMPKQLYNRGGKVVIINLQKTHMDRYSHIRICARCDDVFQHVMSYLKMPIKPYDPSHTIPPFLPHKNRHANEYMKNKQLITPPPPAYITQYNPREYPLDQSSQHHSHLNDASHYNQSSASHLSKHLNDIDITADHDHCNGNVKAEVIRLPKLYGNTIASLYQGV